MFFLCKPVNYPKAMFFTDAVLYYKKSQHIYIINITKC